MTTVLCALWQRRPCHRRRRRIERAGRSACSAAKSANSAGGEPRPVTAGHLISLSVDDDLSNSNNYSRSTKQELRGAATSGATEMTAALGRHQLPTRAARVAQLSGRDGLLFLPRLMSTLAAGCAAGKPIKRREFIGALIPI
jgi:hypothetical protein